MIPSRFDFATVFCGYLISVSLNIRDKSANYSCKSLSRYWSVKIEYVWSILIAQQRYALKTAKGLKDPRAGFP